MSTTRAYDNLRDSRKLAAHHMLVQMSARFRVCARHNARLDEGEGEGDGVRRWTAVAPSDLDTLVAGTCRGSRRCITVSASAAGPQQQHTFSISFV